MNVNPQVAYFRNGFAIRFVRSNWKVLVWVQDMTARKMKSDLTGLPAVTFPTRLEAEAEVRNVVIPYLIKEKDVPPEDIVGW